MKSENACPCLLTSLIKLNLASWEFDVGGRELQGFDPCPVNHDRPGNKSLTIKGHRAPKQASQAQSSWPSAFRSLVGALLAAEVLGFPPTGPGIWPHCDRATNKVSIF